jgi:cell division septum initiation protein DivIVA
MNNNEKWFEALRQWRIGGGVNRGVSLEYVDRLIAYVEELREREIGWTMTLSSLEEENAKLKEELQTFKDRWIGT